MAENTDWGVLPGLFFFPQKVIELFTRKKAANITVMVGGVSETAQQTGGAAEVML